MLKSKRFIAFLISILVFIITILITKFSPVEVASAVSILSAIYIGADTFRPSKDAKEVG